MVGLLCEIDLHGSCGCGSGYVGVAPMGFAFFEEGAAAFLGFVAEVVEHGGVAGEFLYAGLAVELGVEAALDHA